MYERSLRLLDEYLSETPAEQVAELLLKHNYQPIASPSSTDAKPLRNPIMEELRSRITPAEQKEIDECFDRIEAGKSLGYDDLQQQYENLQDQYNALQELYASQQPRIQELELELKQADSIIERLTSALDKAESQWQVWISVKAELPKYNETVLVFYKDMILSSYRYFYETDNRDYWNGQRIGSGIPSHWMPLPSPPTK